jgi:hypothetical protein
MLFAFSGFNLLHLSQMNAVAVVAHLPWVLAATHALLTSGTRGARGGVCRRGPPARLLNCRLATRSMSG